MARRQVDLVDAEKAVGPVGISLDAEAAQPILREQVAELIAVVVGRKAEGGQIEIGLARADYRLSEARLQHRAARAVIEQAQLLGAGRADAVARVGEEGQFLAVEHLAIAEQDVLQSL